MKIIFFCTEQNSYGEICGGPLHPSRPYAFYFDLLECLTFSTPILGCATPTTCVPECPQELFYVGDNFTSPEEQIRIKTMLKPFCLEEGRAQIGNRTVQDLIRVIMTMSR